MLRTSLRTYFFDSRVCLVVHVFIIGIFEETNFGRENRCLIANAYDSFLEINLGKMDVTYL